MQRASRLKKELHMLAIEPPPGVTCWQEKDKMDNLRAQILGGANTPYEKGIFTLEVIVPESLQNLNITRSLLSRKQDSGQRLMQDRNKRLVKRR
ncbi:ubiquitin-conjugating enzyme E2T (putative) (predicted), isoform CRA_c [Rattus norvegicus]|uniref:Ubiquitin-conjugating enzyme E2T (Putative) (Predicted), isoform CRA_c n=1 Tax=Rattus norvegicus TaxID=10116 RepID=A6ICD2_RAT|nr:ubiquitin-conjugating enzyme E2T (putative) (predicted), isoform CRA_c [Rattus norvegicus]EDM09717.1 ubiquitin-conjugating enzyme E2T (putative) (predicted), isoform CRA_c [Rattus norvegicus]